MKQAERDSKVKVSGLRAQAIAGENEAEMKGKWPTGHHRIFSAHLWYVCVIYLIPLLLVIYLILNW